MKSVNVLLIFRKEIMYKPIIYRIAKDFDIVFNVLEAKIFPKQEGRIILGLTGSDMQLDETLNYFKTEGVEVQILADMIKRDEQKCVHCGACTAVCRVDALYINRETMEVIFDAEKCVACGLCRLACPVNAMSGTAIDREI
ncbi:MAG: (Fe-S)-binding protein [Spirochaetae bacterium HGW-Spirochaetae-5]|nr:MAG: (Fe-S)-binding protein [Spirochaetae bacterium HGW-Spirochaetae-5]